MELRQEPGSPHRSSELRLCSPWRRSRSLRSLQLLVLVLLLKLLRPEPVRTLQTPEPELQWKLVELRRKPGRVRETRLLLSSELS